MPTIITHAVVAGVAVKVFSNKQMPFHFWYLAVVCSILPDADVIGFYFGVKYSDFLGHRGFSHSLFFALIISVLIVFIFFKNIKIFSKNWWKFVLFYFIVGSSHGILDAFTDGGLGIALLSPFDNTRYFFPWTPIKVSPINLKAFLSDWGFQVMIYEITYIWIPLFFFFFVFKFTTNKIKQ